MFNYKNILYHSRLELIMTEVSKSKETYIFSSKVEQAKNQIYKTEKLCPKIIL